MLVDDTPIPSDNWGTIFANVPLISVDHVVKHDGGVLLGKRENEPAKGEWFVRGGTVLKNEPRDDALHHVAAEELGEPVVDERLGTFEHFYDTSEVAGVDSKHYVATVYRCHFERDDPEVVGDDQHAAFDVFHPPIEQVHPYVARYLEALHEI